jgi:hypothetical protein
MAPIAVSSVHLQRATPRSHSYRLPMLRKLKMKKKEKKGSKKSKRRSKKK